MKLLIVIKCLTLGKFNIIKRTYSGSCSAKFDPLNVRNFFFYYNDTTLTRRLEDNALRLKPGPVETKVKPRIYQRSRHDI